MKVRVFVTRWIQMKRSAVARIAKCEKEGLCTACLQPLGESRVVRGCHEKCARATYRAIERGEMTDEQRVADGKWLEASQRGPKPSNPVTVEAKLGTV